MVGPLGSTATKASVTDEVTSNIGIQSTCGAAPKRGAYSAACSCTLHCISYGDVSNCDGDVSNDGDVSDGDVSDGDVSNSISYGDVSNCEPMQLPLGATPQRAG